MVVRLLIQRLLKRLSRERHELGRQAGLPRGAGTLARQPFLAVDEFLGMDMQLDIWGTRP